MRHLVIAVALLCCASAAGCYSTDIGEPQIVSRGDIATIRAAPTYPLKKSSNGRYFVDQDSVPVLLHGDTAWSLIGELTREEAEQYLDDCAALEFNSLIVTLVDGHYVSNPPNNAYGVAPFTTPGKFSTPNEAYFQHADWVIQQAAARGIQILLAPVYLGCCDDGWLQIVRDNNSQQDMRAFGVWVGNRYRNTPNLIFHWGNDVFPQQFPAVREKIRVMAEGLRSVDGMHLTTYHGYPEASAHDVWNFTEESWLDFNATYTYEPVWQKSEADYAFSPTTPFVLFESKYENEQGTNAKQQRVQAYQALLSGAAGQFYGNSPIWHMGVLGGNWRAALSDLGRLAMRHVRDLFESRAWYRLVPDISNTALTSGHSTGDDRATAALTDDGATLIVYAPFRRTLTVNLNALSGSNATAWWFNPRDGSVDAGTPLTSSGSLDFTPPSDDDWVLVIDDASSMLPPPGTRMGVPDGGAGSGGTGNEEPASGTVLGLVARYPFISDGAGVVADASGNGNDGSCTPGDSCPVFVADDGQPAGSYDFTGNGNYIELPNESAFDFTTQFSVSLWMRSSNPPNAWAQLIGKGDSAWGIERHDSTNSVSFTTFAPSPDNMVGSTNVFDGQWHHIAAVYDGSQKTLYVDGQVDAQKSYSSTVNTNNVNVRIGFNSEYTSGQYDGLLDDVRIYNRPLSAAEVQALMVPSDPPVVNIDAPAVGTLFRAGDVISFSADASDTEDGLLSDAAFSWEVLLTQGASTSTVLTLDGARAGSFTVPITGLAVTGALQYEVRVTVTDSDGLTDDDSVTLDPDRVALTFDTAPPGLVLYLDGTPSTAPFAIDTLIGYQHALEAPDARDGNQLFIFDSWSDGGAQMHDINAPALLTTFIATYTVTLSDPDLLAWYTFASDGAGIITDASGKGNDANCAPGGTCPAFVSGDGQPAGSYDFTGNGNYIELSNESAFDFTDDFSVLLWMKASYFGGSWAQLVGKGDSAWSLDRAGNGNSLQFTTWAPGLHELVGQTSVAEGQWHHVAIVYDGVQKTLYVDGQIDAQSFYSAQVNTNDVRVHLGYNAEYPSGEYSGRLDDVRIFKRALSQTEIQQIVSEATP